MIYVLQSVLFLLDVKREAQRNEVSCSKSLILQVMATKASPSPCWTTFKIDSKSVCLELVYFKNQMKFQIGIKI